MQKRCPMTFPAGAVKWDSHGEYDAAMNWKILKDWLEQKGLTFPYVDVSRLSSGESSVRMNGATQV